ncbi:MAG: hypothetical protein JST75_13850 [Bacteroidetes bacterium]|nr:hypothetical protein [Bacteroidota bacterium]
MKTINYLRIIFFTYMIMSFAIASAQPITGVWKGKLRSGKIELKLIKKGDSLVGTSYYYDSKNNYRRYSVKGYFDDATNNVIWWDDVLIEDNSSRMGLNPMMAVADFNCPGEDVMKLDGETSSRDDKDAKKFPINLQKGGAPVFVDEWDYVLKNYVAGANDPEIIDSVAMIAIGPAPIPKGYEAAPLPRVGINEKITDGRETPTIKASPVQEIKTDQTPQTVEQKFSTRSKTLQTIIPVNGDSVELKFYDNAEIDGDSIALFLNSKLLKEHIGLTDRAYTIKIPVSELESDNELVMVAENLGSIPPNTSLMVAIIGDKRYEARLQSSEGSSAMVRFVKEGK